MRIGIDCRMLGPEQGGIGRYIEQLVLQLSGIDTENEYILFMRPENVAALKINSKNFNYQTVITPIYWYSWQEQLFFKKIITEQNLTIMHFPHWNVPLWYNDRFIVTIHDLLLLEYPTRAASTLGPVAYWFKQLMYKKVLRHAVTRAEKIIATSEFTKQDIVQKLQIDPHKITVTYQAPFFTSPSAPNTSFLQAHSITKPYVLYVGAAYPHKNLDRLLTAWPEIQIKTNHAYQLVLVGRDHYFYQRLKEKVSTEKITGVIFTGFVPDTQLPHWYANARLFVYPSLYEGFGLPPLEAWVNQVPVAAANRSCLPEVLGDGVFYFNPESISEMTMVICEALTNGDRRNQVNQVAQTRITHFSWHTLATLTRSRYY